MKRILNHWVWCVILASGSFLSLSLGIIAPAHAEDTLSTRQNVEKYEKKAADDQADATKKQSEIKTAQLQMNQDTAMYGGDSSQVQDDRKKISSLRKDLADINVSLQNDLSKEKAQQAAGQVSDSDLPPPPATSNE
jgi:hypothetical protein